MKELWIAAHEEILAELDEEYPNATEAYKESIVDFRVEERMISNMADRIDYYRNLRKEQA